MRRLFVSLITALLLLVIGAPLKADDLVFGFFGDYLESLRAQAGIPGLSAAIVGANDILWERAFGRQDLERSIPTRVDTPFELDGLTQVFTAALTLRCVEEGHLSLDDTVRKFVPDSPDADATLGQLLAHISISSNGVLFAYRPERLQPLAAAISSCTGQSYRDTVIALLDRLAMTSSVPGLDIVNADPDDPANENLAIDRYTSLIERLAVPYTVDKDAHASVSQYTATTLQPAAGLISTVRDLAQFDLALKQGVLLHDDTLRAAWRPAVSRTGDALPHGLGWFAGAYTNGMPVVWQFGESDNASSSLLITLPERQLTLILMANSDRLVKPFALTNGELTSSPFARVFLSIFAR